MNKAVSSTKELESVRRNTPTSSTMETYRFSNNRHKDNAIFWVDRPDDVVAGREIPGSLARVGSQQLPNGSISLLIAAKMELF